MEVSEIPTVITLKPNCSQCRDTGWLDKDYDVFECPWCEK